MMGAHRDEPIAKIEEERYELFEGRRYAFRLDRRELLRFMGGGISVALVLPTSSLGQESGGGRRRDSRRAVSGEIGAWLRIATDSSIVAFTGKAEVGQNIRTSLSQVISEELCVPLSTITMVMGDTELTPFDRGTFGSRTTPIMAAHLRRVAAAARELLRQLAANDWNLDIDQVDLHDGAAQVATSGHYRSIGDISAAHELIHTVSGSEPVTDPSAWTVAGQDAAKIGGRDFVTGAHKYPSDIELPGMLEGKVLRPPRYGATLISVDTTAAEQMPGVTVVVDGDFIGVAARSLQAAEAALSSIRADWKLREHPTRDEFFATMRDRAKGTGSSDHSRGELVGSIPRAMAVAKHRAEASYEIDYIAHVPPEPRAAVADWVDGALAVWTGTQRPFGVCSELADAFLLPEERVRVRMPDTGSGYGGKHTGETAIEAARLAKGAGHPVRIVWTREEEFTWAYFRPAGIIDVAGGVDADGKLVAWEHHNYNSGGSAIETPYDVENQRIQFHRTDSPLRQGSYRALAATANVFARESHMDDLARMASLDPIEFRLRNLSDPRLRGVLEAAAERYGWTNRANRAGRGHGLAVGLEKGGYVATCAEVAADTETGDVRVVRVVAAFECGAILNPDHLLHQVEGGLVMGLGGTLFEAINFSHGRVRNPRLSLYRVPRFSDMPEIDVVLLDRTDLPSAGAGETPIVGIAPAVRNAILDATGLKLYSLPLVPNGLPI